MSNGTTIELQPFKMASQYILVFWKCFQDNWLGWHILGKSLLSKVTITIMVSGYTVWIVEPLVIFLESRCTVLILIHEYAKLLWYSRHMQHKIQWICQRWWFTEHNYCFWRSMHGIFPVCVCGCVCVSHMAPIFLSLQPTDHHTYW